MQAILAVDITLYLSSRRALWKVGGSHYSPCHLLLSICILSLQMPLVFQPGLSWEHLMVIRLNPSFQRFFMFARQHTRSRKLQVTIGKSEIYRNQWAYCQGVIPINNHTFQHFVLFFFQNFQNFLPISFRPYFSVLSNTTVSAILFLPFKHAQRNWKTQILGLPIEFSQSLRFRWACAVRNKKALGTRFRGSHLRLSIRKFYECKFLTFS